MSHWWDQIKKIQEKFTLFQWVVVTVMFLAGASVNAIYQFVDWVTVPFNNQRDITILLEKSEEFSNFFEKVKNIQTELNQARNDNEKLRKDIDADNEKLRKEVENMGLELKATIRRLEDGQLQLFLKTERLDERTRRK